MSTITAPPTEAIRLDFESAGRLLTPEEFDAVADYDELYRYELIHGVLVVTPIPSEAEVGPNEHLGRWLLNYREDHPLGKSLDDTLPEARGSRDLGGFGETSESAARFAGDHRRVRLFRSS